MVVSASLGTVAYLAAVVDVRELTPGLWRWTAPHPEWEPGFDWEREVGSVAADVEGALALVDPLVPDDGWDALDALVERVGKPVATLLTVEWHARSSAAVRARYAQHDGQPGGVEGRSTGTTGFAETVYWLPAHGALVCGDLLIGEQDGGVRLAPASWFDEDDAQRGWYAGDLPAFVAELAALPVERVLVSHGEPVLTGGREALAAALR
jgi:glyoxylase-like metal-dependent hydrolase (beta-lactamase superfamily II)